MAQCITIEPTRTYATVENVHKAVARVITNPALANLRYMVQQHTDGRFFPLFVGQESVRAGIYFHFNVVA